MEGDELFERDGAGLVQPAQVRRKIGQRRFDQDPASRFVDLPKALQRLDILGCGIRFEEGAEIALGVDAAGSREFRGPREKSLLGRIPADHRQQRELRERPLQLGRGG